MQPKRFFGQVSHIPSQRSGFVGLLQDLIHISGLQDNYKMSEPVLSPSEESHVVDEAKKGNKTAQEKLVDHYDTLAANAFLKADSAKDEEERRKFQRQWCFYASRAEEIDCPSSVKDVQRMERLFYIGHPPKEAKKLITIQTVKFNRFKMFLGGAWGCIMGAFFLWTLQLSEVPFNPLPLIAGVMFGLLGIWGVFTAVAGKYDEEKIYICGNCGDKVYLSSYTCPTCKTTLKD